MTAPETEMTTKQKSPAGPVHDLYAAAYKIIKGTREVFTKQGQDARELRIPILMHGTDMRVTIEAGPKIAARNAIEHAQMEASGKPVEPTVDISAVINEAKALLAEDAEAVKNCHTLNGEWKGEAEEKAHYDRCMATIAGLAELERLV